MSKEKGNLLAWTLIGTAFVMLMTSTGCARKGCCSTCSGAFGSGSSAGTQLPSFPARDTPFFQPVQFDRTPPGVNRFGEFDGMPGAQPTVGYSESVFQQHSFVEEGFDGDVAVSPDGKWLVFSSTRHNERADIYLQRIGGHSVTQLTNDAADDAFPVFSPDGKRLAFSSTRTGTWDIYVMDLAGRGTVQVTSGPSQDLHPSFSPDGNRLVYSSMGSRSGQWELWTVDLRSNQRKMIGYGLFPSWSPDRSSDRIAFQRARARGSRWFSLWTLDLVEGEPHHITEVAVSTNAAIVSPVWSPDGKRLAFSTIVEPTRLKNGKPLGQQDIWIIDADGANRQRLTDGQGTNATPFWGPDQRVYFVSDRGGNDAIWSAPVRSVLNSSMNAANEQQERDTVGVVE